MPPTHDLAVPARALAIGAHPDDIEFGCGATLAKWATQGCLVHLLVLTDGSKGTWDAQANITALVARRQTEQHDAASILNASQVHMLDYIDGELEVSLAARAQVCSVIRSTQPDVVLGHDPWKQYRLHPDHHAAGQLTLDGIVAARDPHFFREQDLQRHRPSALLLFEAQVQDHFESVDGFIDHKVAALLAHVSQYESTHGIANDREAQTESFRAGIRAQALSAAKAAPHLTAAAEAFKLITEL